jgi:hypothetical protein
MAAPVAAFGILPQDEINKALKEMAIQLPLAPPAESGQLLAHLGRAFDGYQRWISGLVTASAAELRQLAAAHTDIVALQDALLQALEAQLLGEPARALSILTSALTSAPVAAAITQTSTDVAAPGRLGNLCRFRVDDEIRGWDREQLFHIPFQLRHRVGVQRFSIAGVPCLYLGATSYACWEELGRPDPARVAASRVVAIDDLQILNLARMPHDFDATYAFGAFAPFFQAYFRLWPLVAACSVPRKHTEAKALFHEEYLLPQLVLQWVRASGLDGVRYSCTRAPLSSLDLRANYVFPARTSQKSGHCSELKSIFELTEPVSWAATKHASLLPSQNLHAPALTGRQGELRDLYPRTSVNYAGTAFCTLDMELATLPTAPLP